VVLCARLHVHLHPISALRHSTPTRTSRAQSPPLGLSSPFGVPEQQPYLLLQLQLKQQQFQQQQPYHMPSRSVGLSSLDDASEFQQHVQQASQGVCLVHACLCVCVVYYPHVCLRVGVRKCCVRLLISFNVQECLASCLAPRLRAL